MGFDPFVDVSELFDRAKESSGTFSAWLQLLFITVCYVLILIYGSQKIADGGELLLLVPSLSGIVGGIILPILGAVPDGAMILFSGLGDDAAKEVAVGVGALSGSTVMLLTIPVFCALLGGGKTDPEHPNSFLKKFVSPLPYVAKSSWTILITGIFYITLQICCFIFKTEDPSSVPKSETTIAAVHCALCMAGFVAYLIYQYRSSLQQNETDQKADALAIEQIRSNNLSFKTAIYQLNLQKVANEEPARGLESMQSLDQELVPNKSDRRVRKILKPFFKMFDADHNGSLDKNELSYVLLELHENLPAEHVEEMFNAADTDHSGTITFDEFCDMIINYVKVHPENKDEPAQASGENGEEEENEIPPDLADLPPEIQQKKIKQRAFGQLLFGLLLVFVFSDPAVSCFNEIGKRSGIPSFFVSFVLAPFVSNGSELLSAYVFAAKKTSETISISLSTLIGAAAMNNTFCLGILLICISAKRLAWDYLSQVIGTMLAEIGCIVVIMLWKKVTMVHALINFAIYPLAIMVIYFVGKWTGHWSSL